MIGRVYIRFIATSLGYTLLWVIRHNCFWYTAKERKSPYVRFNEVRKLLGPGGLGISVVACSKGCNEDLSLHYLAGIFVNHRDGLPCIVYKHLFSTLMNLAKGWLNVTFPTSVKVTELAVAVSIRVSV